MTSDSIAGRLAAVRERIAAACVRAGRPDLVGDHLRTYSGNAPRRFSAA
jgi:hypothetical protein